MREFHVYGFEMVGHPSSKVSGKNSADIRMVVDAIDLCYSKSHIDTFALLTATAISRRSSRSSRRTTSACSAAACAALPSDLLAGNCDESSSTTI